MRQTTLTPHLRKCKRACAPLPAKTRPVTRLDVLRDPGSFEEMSLPYYSPSKPRRSSQPRLPSPGLKTPSPKRAARSPKRSPTRRQKLLGKRKAKGKCRGGYWPHYPPTPHSLPSLEGGG